MFFVFLVVVLFSELMKSVSVFVDDDFYVR